MNRHFNMIARKLPLDVAISSPYQLKMLSVYVAAFIKHTKNILSIFKTNISLQYIHMIYPNVRNQKQRYKVIITVEITLSELDIGNYTSKILFRLEILYYP